MWQPIKEVRSKDPRYFEKRLQASGFLHVAGTDEVGRGCLAGPVFAAAVILPSGLSLPGVTDSKKLTPQKRECLVPVIEEAAVAWAVAAVGVETIDRINIHHASLQAMREALLALSVKPDCVLIDGKYRVADESLFPHQYPLIKGDLRSQTIAAASILAKVRRDHWMSALVGKYPQYHFEKHKGYATKIHREAIRKHGILSLHRRSFCLIRE